MGQSPAGNTVSGNCSGTEFHQGKVFFGEKYIKASDQYTSSPTKFAPKNSVLLCVRAPVGKVNITDRGLCIGRGLCAIIPLAGMPLLFAYYLLAAYENIFVKQATGTTFVAITAETVKSQLIPMPPLAEQQRIADLIERLIPYVDEYGKAESAVDQLNCHFPEALKKSILQEAVQGKLVSQDPSDEPAEALLERIRVEKQRLIKEGKIKKDKHESVIFRRDNSHYEKLDGVEHCIDEELPFEIPESWAWVRLGTILSVSSGDSLTGAQMNSAGSIPVYGGNGIAGTHDKWNVCHRYKKTSESSYGSYTSIYSGTTKSGTSFSYSNLELCSLDANSSYDFHLQIQDKLYSLSRYAIMSPVKTSALAVAGTKPSEDYRIHTVVHGDTLWAIAKKYLGNGSRYKEIVSLNGLKSNVIYSGMKLKIPNK